MLSQDGRACKRMFELGRDFWDESTFQGLGVWKAAYRIFGHGIHWPKPPTCEELPSGVRAHIQFEEFEGRQFRNFSPKLLIQLGSPFPNHDGDCVISSKLLNESIFPYPSRCLRLKLQVLTGLWTTKCSLWPNSVTSLRVSRFQAVARGFGLRVSWM